MGASLTFCAIKKNVMTLLQPLVCDTVVCGTKVCCLRTAECGGAALMTYSAPDVRRHISRKTEFKRLFEVGRVLLLCGDMLLMAF